MPVSPLCSLSRLSLSLTLSWNTSCVSWKMPRTAAFFSSRDRPRFLDYGEERGREVGVRAGGRARRARRGEKRNSRARRRALLSPARAAGRALLHPRPSAWFRRVTHHGDVGEAGGEEEGEGVRARAR